MWMISPLRRSKDYFLSRKQRGPHHASQIRLESKVETGSPRGTVRYGSIEKKTAFIA
jgi:hypothetical protein